MQQSSSISNFLLLSLSKRCCLLHPPRPPSPASDARDG
jgi:hypothetical protein